MSYDELVIVLTIWT